MHLLKLKRDTLQVNNNGKNNKNATLAELYTRYARHIFYSICNTVNEIKKE